LKDRTASSEKSRVVGIDLTTAMQGLSELANQIETDLQILEQ
jgi:hypothetical protein